MDGCFEAHGTRRDMSRFLSPERWKSQFGDARGVARARRGAKETVGNGRKRTVSVYIVNNRLQLKNRIIRPRFESTLSFLALLLAPRPGLGASNSRCNCDFSDEFGKEFSSLFILSAFSMLNISPLTVTRHFLPREMHVIKSISTRVS